MNIQKNVAATLKMFQTQKKLSLTEFADRIGIGKSSLQEYIAGKRNLRSDTLELIADRLHIPVASLVSGKTCSDPALDALSDACQALHPQLQPAAAALLHALEELFHLSSESYAMKQQEKNTESSSYLYILCKATVKSSSGSHTSYGMSVKEKRGDDCHIVAITAPFSDDCTAVLKLTQYCSKHQFPPDRLLWIVQDFLLGKLCC